ncbi:MAG: peptidase [Aureliella sp.]
MNNKRRIFLAATAATCLASSPVHSFGAAIIHRRSPLVIGEGEYQYEVIHEYPELPSQYSWQTTHNVAVDESQNLYVIHEGDVSKKEHPSIFVFDASGKFVRAFGEQFQGGGHGLEIKTEGSEEFLFVTGYKSIKSIAKLTLNGETVWSKRAPMESGVYRSGEDKDNKFAFQRDRFLPTNFGFLPDDGFLMADGYGSFRIHRYDRDANWVSCFGEPGKGPGQFQTPHGLCVDARDESNPTVLVADRANNRIQRLTLDGEHLETWTGFGLPANIHIQDDLTLVPELRARLSILDAKGNTLVQLGDDVARLKADKKNRIRVTPSQWMDGKFMTPHDACFDAQGNIFVAEYVPGLGRVTKLKKIS